MLDVTEKKPEQTKVVVTPPNVARAKVKIVGTAPYLYNRFSQGKMDRMEAKQRAGSSTAKTRRGKPPKDFEKDFRESMHVAQKGWYGIPATALRNAMIAACRYTEMDMTRARGCLFIVAQGLDKENLEPLVQVYGKPRQHIEPVRIGINQTDLASRGLIEKWHATFEVEWDNDIFKAQDVFNLLTRAGWQVGIGAGRPGSKTSGGTGKGTFNVEQAK